MHDILPEVGSADAADIKQAADKRQDELHDPAADQLGTETALKRHLHSNNIVKWHLV